MLGRAVRLSIIVGLVACGPKGGADEARLPPGAADYAGLRWVSADATYVVAARRSEDAVLVLRDLADSFGMLDGQDAASIGAELVKELGFDPLTPASVADRGLDLSRGLAVWSRGLGPTFALPLADPARVAAMIEEQRGHGAVVQVQKVGDVELYSWRPDRDASLHWAIVEDWLLVHVEFREEHEVDRAWFDAALKAQGGFAAEPDFAAARADAEQRIGAPGLIGVVRVPALFATAIGAELASCRPTLGQVGRIFVSASTDGRDARGALVAELANGTDGIRALQVRQPSGWATARGEAPLQVEVGLDVRAVGAAFGRCLDVDDLVGEPIRNGIYAGRAFAHDINVDDLEGRGAAAVTMEQRAFASAVADIPAPDFLRKSRKVGAVGVTELNVPMMPHVAYAYFDGTAVGAVDQPIDPLLGALEAPGDELARIEVRPQVWSADVWNQLLRQVTRSSARERTVRALRKWSLGAIHARLEGRAVVIDLHGAR